MDHLLKIGYLALNCLFFVFFIINLIVTLIRQTKAKKLLITHPLTVKGKVRQIKKTDKKNYLTIEFVSPQSLINFTQVYQFAVKDKALNDFSEGQEIELKYYDYKKLLGNKEGKKKKLRCFPLVLKDDKPKLDSGIVFINIALVGMGLYMLWFLFDQFIRVNGFSPSTPFVGEADKAIYASWLPVIVMLVVYAVLGNFILDNVFSIPRLDNQNYLKIAGYRAKGRVVTFKLVGKKNNKGFKESEIKIEYYDYLGQKIEATLNSYLYTETQEEYIDILYDPYNTSNVVYLKQ